MMQESVPPSFAGTAAVEARQANQHALGVVLLLSTTVERPQRRPTHLTVEAECALLTELSAWD